MLSEEEKISALSKEQIEQYQRDGYIVPDYRLPPEKVEKLQKMMQQIVRDNPTLLNQPIICPNVRNSGVQGLKVDDPEGWMDVATDPQILDIMEALIGPDLILWGSALFYKAPHKGLPTPWHRDGRFFPIKPLETSSVWIAIYDSVIENGCLRVIPGSHLARDLGVHVTTPTTTAILQEVLSETEYDESQAVDIELKAGQMVIFDVYTTHGANGNSGTLERGGFSLRFMPSTSHYDHAAAERTDQPGGSWDTRPLFLLRGVDRCGKNDFTRGHPQPQAATEPS
ncbi:phytanoyl-CoA dioxygenase family protein [Paraburkholderia fungorum]|uniref:Phytanoyl-CoA dioxygenase family protein n=1 Tax=Paraburkholderia fungorum TaxID=134537 RepID=A0AAU8T9H8_9BURK|nr:phytanoyl-CoA dioxygenase family protein [Paraburkholderia fungorum]AJZ56750.1 phytanoyl-CoA dioxygenase family protein [Paraburkholderia fungorum]